MIEKLFKEKWLEKKHIYSFYMGVIYTIISFFTAWILFQRTPNFIGVATIFFIVILTLPSINKLLSMEEKLEKSKKTFWQKHETILDFFIYFFIGTFLVFLVIAYFSPEMVLSGLTQKKVEYVSGNLPPPPIIQESLLKSIFLNNLLVMFICFLLSLFYGSGAIFLITLNASIFASALAQSVKLKLVNSSILFTFTFLSCNTAIMFFHMLPELGGYFIAAIAGGVLSKAYAKERFMSNSFKIIVKDSFILLILSVIVLGVAALIEVFLSKKLFQGNVCDGYTVLILALILISLFIIHEYKRKNIYRRKYINKKR